MIRLTKTDAETLRLLAIENRTVRAALIRDFIEAAVAECSERRVFRRA